MLTVIVGLRASGKTQVAQRWVRDHKTMTTLVLTDENKSFSAWKDCPKEWTWFDMTLDEAMAQVQKTTEHAKAHSPMQNRTMAMVLDGIFCQPSDKDDDVPRHVVKHILDLARFMPVCCVLQDGWNHSNVVMARKCRNLAQSLLAEADEIVVTLFPEQKGQDILPQCMSEEHMTHLFHLAQTKHKWVRFRMRMGKPPLVTCIDSDTGKEQQLVWN